LVFYHQHETTNKIKFGEVIGKNSLHKAHLATATTATRIVADKKKKRSKNRKTL